jgi:ring-1,2-phenylacetyl-CoA epoxidase subunit PaaE
MTTTTPITPPAARGTLFHPLRVRAVQPDADDAVLVSFEVPEALQDVFRFQQGQYLTLRNHDLDGQDLRRSYSICTGTEDGDLRVGVRKVDSGPFSTWLNDRLRVGDVVQVLPPQGNFFVPLQPEAGRDYLGIAGGSGITPILSIIRTVLAREPHSRFTLIYGNRNQKSTMFKEEIEDLKNRYMTRLVLHHVFSREHTDSPLNSGRMTRAKLGEFFEHLVDPAQLDHVFVCGPFGINDEAEAALRDAGVPQERIHIERFGVPPSAGEGERLQKARAGDAESARIVIIRDGLSREISFGKNDPNILDAAAAAGLEVPFSCKSGVCSTCRAKVMEGEVRMDRNFALEKHEVDAGFVLTCQAHPMTARVVLSFDER